MSARVVRVTISKTQLSRCVELGYYIKRDSRLLLIHTYIFFFNSSRNQFILYVKKENYQLEIVSSIYPLTEIYIVCAYFFEGIKDSIFGILEGWANILDFLWKCYNN